MSAKEYFIERIYSFKDSLALESVTDKALTHVKHNQIAKLLRNGLAVVGFAALEDFVKKRTSEVLSGVGRTGVPFDRLPQKLRYAVTFGSLAAVTQQMLYRESEEKVTFVQEQAIKISSTLNSVYELTEYAFGYSAPNVRHDDIQECLKAFNVHDPWANMTNIASRIGFIGLPLKNSFLNASKRRHKAAHVVYTDTPNFDLHQYIKEALAVAIGYDCLISECLKLLDSHNSDYMDGNKVVSSSDIKLRFIKREGNLWKEYREGVPRAYRTDQDMSAIRLAAERRSIEKKETLVIFNEYGDVLEWICY